MEETQNLFSKEQSEVLFRVYDFLIKLADEEQENAPTENTTLAGSDSAEAKNNNDSIFYNDSKNSILMQAETEPGGLLPCSMK